jgi:hypothetical protein
MLLQKDQFPITIQAYDISGNAEIFIAEQVVNTQAEVDTFSNRYAGKLIKAKGFSNSGASNISSKKHNRSSSTGTTIIVILLILIILVAIGFYTGWIQRTTGISL